MALSITGAGVPGVGVAIVSPFLSPSQHEKGTLYGNMFYSRKCRKGDLGLSSLPRCFSSGLCDVELGRWVIRGPGLRDNGDTDVVSAGTAEGMPRGLLPLPADEIAWSVPGVPSHLEFATFVDTTEHSYHLRCTWGGRGRV